ncbi:MAG: hypothetical protein IJJ23_07560 [Clostridia bacterium]|nr:hypothetical protein [Clostridia bacterium]
MTGLTGKTGTGTDAATAEGRARARRQVRILLHMWGREEQIRSIIERERRAGQAARRANRDLRWLDGMVRAMEHGLGRLTPEQNRILRLRYKKRMMWVAVGLRMYMDESYARRLARRAEEALARERALRAYFI